MKAALADAKMAYLKRAEAAILKLDSRHAGTIQWADLIHGFNVGRTVQDTAARYVISYNVEGAAK
jgi:hypothetical protein